MVWSVWRIGVLAYWRMMHMMWGVGNAGAAVYCVCQIAARASPAEQCVALGMMKPNRRRNRDQTTHTALNSKLKQLN